MHNLQNVYNLHNVYNLQNSQNLHNLYNSNMCTYKLIALIWCCMLKLCIQHIKIDTHAPFQYVVLTLYYPSLHLGSHVSNSSWLFWHRMKIKFGRVMSLDYTCSKTVWFGCLWMRNNTLVQRNYWGNPIRRKKSLLLPMFAQIVNLCTANLNWQCSKLLGLPVGLSTLQLIIFEIFAIFHYNIWKKYLQYLTKIFAGPHLPEFLLPFRKPKRIRTAFSPNQLLKLEQVDDNDNMMMMIRWWWYDDNLIIQWHDDMALWQYR